MNPELGTAGGDAWSETSRLKIQAWRTRVQPVDQKISLETSGRIGLPRSIARTLSQRGECVFSQIFSHRFSLLQDHLWHKAIRIYT